METNGFRIEVIGNRIVCLKGIGKLFYQEGFPISLAISHMKQIGISIANQIESEVIISPEILIRLRKNGIECSILHIADELLKHGWSPETTMKKLKWEIEDSIQGDDESIKAININILDKFCYSNYEDQREIIFQYLFGRTSEDAITNFEDFKDKHSILMSSFLIKSTISSFKEFLNQNKISYKEKV